MPPDAHAPGNHLRIILIVMVLMLTGGGVTLGLAAASQHHAPQPGQAAAGRISPSPGSPAGTALPWAGETAQQLKTTVTGPVLPYSVPVSLDVPAAGITSPGLLQLGLASDGTMEVPPLFGQPSEAGWYKFSPAPGQAGPAVIAGHVDTYKGASVFYQLGAVRAGQIIDIGRADRTVAVFQVTGVRSYTKTSFPAKTVYGPVNRAELRLITCGGTFDTATHSYLSSTVVFATLISSHG